MWTATDAPPLTATPELWRRRLAGAFSLSRNALALGAGAAVSRLGTFILTAAVGRIGGVHTLGVYALGQTLFQYTITGIDLGLKPIGARLVATSKHPTDIRQVVRAVQGKRFFLALAVIPIGILYALTGPLPDTSRITVAIFVVSASPNCMGLDWLLWGTGRFLALGLWRAGMAVILSGIALMAILIFHKGIAWVALANGASSAIGAAVTWIWYKSAFRDTPRPHEVSRVADVERETSWGQVWSLSLALILSQAFQTIDTLILGAFRNTSDVGFYNAAYGILVLIFGGYYQLIQASYPALAKLRQSDGSFRKLLLYAGFVCALGIVVAGSFRFLADPLISLIYGRSYAVSARLLSILLLAVPLEFAGAVLSTALVAWGYSKQVLITNLLAAAANVGANLVLVPRFGAVGAAWSTPLSYVVFVSCLFAMFAAGPSSIRADYTVGGRR